MNLVQICLLEKEGIYTDTRTREIFVDVLTNSPFMIFCRDLIEDRETGLRSYIHTFSKLRLPTEILEGRGISFWAAMMRVPIPDSERASWKIFANDEELLVHPFAVSGTGELGNFSMSIIGAKITESCTCRVELVFENGPTYAGEFEVEATTEE